MQTAVGAPETIKFSYFGVMFSVLSIIILRIYSG